MIKKKQLKAREPEFHKKINAIKCCGKNQKKNEYIYIYIYKRTTIERKK
jgi:hypothetical protein